MSTANSLTSFGKFMGKNSDYIEIQYEYLSLDILPGPNDFLLICFFFSFRLKQRICSLLKTRTKVAGKSKAIMNCRVLQKDE